MNGKMRDGIMLRIAALPNTNRKMTARLPVQNAIGRPSASSTPSEPNSKQRQPGDVDFETHRSGPCPRYKERCP